MIRIKESNKRQPYIVEDWLKNVDIYSRNGIDVLAKHNVHFVHQGKADVGISWHGDVVDDVPIDKCILFRSEPPIYNLFYGRNLCNPKYVKKFMGILSIYEYGDYPQTHFLYPCVSSLFKYTVEYFNKPKKEMLCMVLRNKKMIIRLNNLFPKLKKFNYYSNMNIRIKADKVFANMLAHTNYHSYGRGWDSRCFKGQIENREDIYKIFASHKYTFCPENSRFKGFITEKPMQAMFCGSIPIYLGAPDVHKYLPKGTFIDYRYFTPGELVEYLKRMSEKEYNTYRKNIKKFITSKEAVEMFSTVQFANKILSFVEN